MTYLEIPKISHVLANPPKFVLLSMRDATTISSDSDFYMKNVNINYDFVNFGKKKNLTKHASSTSKDLNLSGRVLNKFSPGL